MSRFLLSLLLLTASGFCNPVLAEESGVDGSAYLSWWSNNFSANALDASFDAGTVGAEGEVWWAQKWGIKGSLYKSDVV